MNFPKNFRDVNPRCCHSCKHMQNVNDAPVCERDTEYVIADFDGETIYTTICDYYVKKFK